jgi:hypothetical protein
MKGMSSKWAAFAVFALLSASAGRAAPPVALSHRVWLLGALPDGASLAELRVAGVDGLVVPVGKVELTGDTSHFSLSTLPDLKALAGWPLTALVWADGNGRAAGDPATFAAQLAPVQRTVPGKPGLLFVSTQFSPGVVAFARGVAEKLHERVELALPAPELARALGEGGWGRLHPVAVAFGNPPALGFPPSTLQDDLSALERLDAVGVPYRVVVVVAPHAVPPPGPAGASLAAVAGAETATYRPGERGDTFLLRKPVDWGGTIVGADRSITVEMVDTARYDRDLGMLLRPARPDLEGWDTAGLPAPDPTIGMNRKAFLDYLEGGSTYPSPEVAVERLGTAALRIALINPTEQASAVATTGNWVELRFEGTDVRDVQLGDFSGMEYGRLDGGVWRRTVARDASAVRLYLTFLAPRARIAGCLVTFLSPPRSVSTRWGLRIGDGSNVTGRLETVLFTAR